MNYLRALALTHGTLKPVSYLEIGCRRGASLSLAACPSVAIDPDFAIEAQLGAPTRIFKLTSDDFFARPDVATILGGSIDLAFIDGMHLVEFTLRDFAYLEKHSADRSVILIDDVLPQDIAWAKRERDGQFWTGDVYRIIPILRKYRPDLRIEVFDVGGKGLAIISGLDPQSPVLSHSYRDIEGEIEAGEYCMFSAQEIRRRLLPRPAAELEAHLQALAASRTAKRSFDSSIRGNFLQHYQRGVLGYSYRGVPCLKSPIDLALYLKLIWDLQPRTIVEIGTKAGGSALLWADLLKMYGLVGQVYTIDLSPPDVVHDRVTFLAGEVSDLGGVFEREQLIDAPRPWLVTEDSAHTFDGCLAALRYLATAMKPGDVLVMEDGNLAELGLVQQYGGGPSRAIQSFLAEQPGVFEILSAYCDMFGPNATYNPNGYLRKL